MDKKKHDKEEFVVALTTILLDNDGTLVDTYTMILESFKHATQEVLGKQFSEA